MILTYCRKEPSKTKGWRCKNKSLGIIATCFSLKQRVMLWVAGNCSWPKQLCWSRVHACLPMGTLLSMARNGKIQT